MTIKVRMVPHIDDYRKEESGIRRVIESYFRHLPKYDIELVDRETKRGNFDLLAVHAGAYDGPCDVAHNHGLYWTADLNTAAWEWRTNSRVVTNIRHAKEVTVPSTWVAETFQRDMRFAPHIIGHGIDWNAWQGIRDKRNHILWNKNRIGDVCDPEPVRVLAEAFPQETFVSTFKMWDLPNIQDTGVIPFPEMREYIMTASVYLSTVKETFGIGTLEAMASGVPILGFAKGGNLDLVDHGVNGYLAKPGDWEDLINGLAYCLEHGKMLGDNGREISKAWTWEASCEKVAEVYKKALEPDPPTVSVVIPSFNYGHSVGKAVESAIQQDYDGTTQIVVIDDGSKDDGETERVVEELRGRDSRIRYIRQANSGVAVARNRGISEVNTKYICCLDADDAIEESFISTCVKELERDRSLGIAYTGLRMTDAEGHTQISKWPSEFDYDAQLQRRNQVPTCCVFRREAWERTGGYRSRYCPKGAGSEDAHFWTMIGSIGYGAKLAEPFPKFLSTYHTRKKGLGREPKKMDLVGHGITEEEYELAVSSLFNYSIGTGLVTGDPEYREVDWLRWMPCVEDQQHPFASIATPKHKWAHAVRQYDEPLVSVIIPVGPGHEKEIINALDSLDAQTFRKWEVIVVADGTSIPKEIRTAYPYVKWFGLEENSGAGAARNLGAMFARAPFLVFLDADDWLYPECLMTMLQAWNLDEAIIYTDYVGKSTVANPDALIPSLKEKLYQWDEETGDAIIGYSSADYACKLAQQQPEYTGNAEMPFYHWCLVTCLIPKTWHEEIGGFDESMESWEDVDYHWRMAKAGKCYIRVEEELIVYRFNTGLRRQEGLQAFPKIVEYLEDKYKEIEVVMCNCGGGRSRTGQKAMPAPQTVPQRVAARMAQPQQQQAGSKMNDNDFVKAEYLHPNQGTHQVSGQHRFQVPIDGLRMRNVGDGFIIDYGYRKGGETFLVHRNDLISHLFREVQTAAGGVFNPPQPSHQPTPVPETIIREARVPVELRDEIDLQLLPGINDQIALLLKNDGISTKTQVLELGIDGLKQYKGIGEVKAKSIIEAIHRMNV